MEEKNLSLERLVFFSDAVVAIAITLLALDIRVEATPIRHLHFADIGEMQVPLAAFALSFFFVYLSVHFQTNIKLRLVISRIFGDLIVGNTLR